MYYAGEFMLLSRMLSLGVLCRMDAAVVEFHAEQNPAWRTLMEQAGGVVPKFQSHLNYMVTHAGRGCKVLLNVMSAHAQGS